MKKILLIASLCLFAMNATANEINSTETPPTNTNAIAFAAEAGKIAGIALGCGQNVDTFTNRVGEALNKLALNMTDKILAIKTFQSTSQKVQQKQMTNHPIPCEQAMRDLNSLPIMQSDYQQNVIAKLSPDMGTGAPNTPPAQNPMPTNSSAATAPTNPMGQNSMSMQQYIDNKTAQ